MKNQKGFIQIPLLIAIVVGVLVLGGGGYFGLQQYQSYQDEKNEQKKQAELNRKTEEEQRQKLQELFDSQNEELQKQKSEIKALQNRKPEIITETIIKEVPVQKTENDISAIVQLWRPIVVRIECDRQGIYPSGEIVDIGIVSGSGIAMYVQNSYAIWTNAHVTASSGGKLCRIYFPDNNSPIISIRGRLNSAWSEDFVIIDIPNPGEYLGNIIKKSVNANPFCSQTPSIGDKVVILGYPGIGSQIDITATEGIISGYDGNYFITSAKVEQGNSGGAAILVKDNCYLGIPTFAQTGVIESLARILDWHKFGNK